MISGYAVRDDIGGFSVKEGCHVPCDSGKDNRDHQRRSAYA